jgi:transcriptional regulator with XRE-family HTH domain
MDNRFSNNFKELRKMQELTQEQIAEMLGVTSQAISKWECGTSYPDIGLLPVIANMFKVSTDYLLGVDITKQEKDIQEIIGKAKELDGADKSADAVVLLRNALIQYPSNCDIMYWLAWSLRGTIRQHPEHEHEAINIYRRILNISKNSELICKVTRDLAYCYYTLGDVQTAKAYVDMLPSFEVCREYNLGRSNVVTGKDLADVLQNNIRLYATAIQKCLEYFANENILKEDEMFPYSTQIATKHLENIKEFLK